MTSFKSSLNRFEIAGAFGDLPLLLPLLVGLVKICHLNPIPVFIITGFSYIICGIFYRVPIPIQPLKAFTIIAISKQLSPSVIHTGTLLIGTIFLFLSFSQITKFLTKIFPFPVIKGLQLSLGFLLLKSGAELIFTKNLVLNENSINFNNFLNLDLLLVIMGIFILLLFSNSKKVPCLLIVILLGIMVSFLFCSPTNSFTNKVSQYKIFLPSLKDLKFAFLLLVIPQIPLTLANSVIATTDATNFYFGEKAKRVNYRNLCFSIGLINLFSGIFGGMPSCHGSGGVTAHYCFGARTGIATSITGLFFLLSVFLFRENLINLFNFFPFSLLGLLLFYVGYQHALLAKQVNCLTDFFIVLTIGFVSLITGNLTISFLSGFFLFYLLKILNNNSFSIILKNKKV